MGGVPAYHFTVHVAYKGLIALVLVAAVGCGGAGLAIPTFGLPQFDTAAVDRLVRDARAEVDRLASTPIELPPELAALLGEHDIRVAALPSNAAEICQALGTPGVGTVASAGLAALIEGLVAGGEVGGVVGIMVAVIFRTCPVWMPHLETALEVVL